MDDFVPNNYIFLNQLNVEYKICFTSYTQFGHWNEFVQICYMLIGLGLGPLHDEQRLHNCFRHFSIHSNNKHIPKKTSIFKPTE